MWMTATPSSPSYCLRQEFAKFLTRPSTKQEFVTHWQKLYNKVRDDLHQDKEMKKELHHRVDVSDQDKK